MLTNLLENSEIDLQNIDLIVPHGVATSVTDKLEASVWERICNRFGFNPYFTAFKPYVGHNLGGCTLLELALTIACLHFDTILPILNTTEFLPHYRLNYTSKIAKSKLQFVIKSCSAFAGFNSAVMLKKT